MASGNNEALLSLREQTRLNTALKSSWCSHTCFASPGHFVVVGEKVWSTKSWSAKDSSKYLDAHIEQICWSEAVDETVKCTKQNTLALPTY